VLLEAVERGFIVDIHACLLVHAHVHLRHHAMVVRQNRELTDARGE
jgi:hypothetical protein